MTYCYYEQEGITIYHGDCADVFPLVAPAAVDLLLTDPPYGIGLDTDYAGSQNKNVSFNSHALVAGDAIAFDPTPLQACHEMGRRYIGVEIVEKYCEIAVQRLAQGVLAL